MFLIQDICLSWSKEERNADCAKVRAKFPKAYILDKIPDNLCKDIFIHRVNFRQKGTLLQNLYMSDMYRFQFYSSVYDVNLVNLSIRSDIDGYEVIFFYDERRSGCPIRRGHNKDYHNINSLLYRHDILNETAFFLKKEQYGRVIWNERKIDCDTGEWYYQLHILNLLPLLNKFLKEDIFLVDKPDFEYKQMAIL